MQGIVKYIREYLNMDIAGLAAALDTAQTELCQWEEEFKTPEHSLQLKLYDLCKTHNVPVYDMILRRVENTAAAIKQEPGKIILYHGSKSGIIGDIKPESRPQCDFGSGFYMGSNPAQALTLICDYEESKFYVTSLDTNDITITLIPADIEWAMFIARNRGKMEKIKGTAFYNKYRDMAGGSDVIAGSIANDRMFFVLDNFFMGNITDTALVHSLSALELGRQYAVVSQKGCDAVCIEKEIALSHIERMFLKEAAEQNRETGIASANSICREYRREGVFFDEILDRAALEANK